VSVGLVVSYLRAVAGTRFALREAGLAQLVFLVLFSYAFFFEGYTGLTVTIGAVLTLHALVASFDGTRVVRSCESATVEREADAVALAGRVAATLVGGGAAGIIAECRTAVAAMPAGPGAPA